ncbi:phospho-acceptor domain-containing protein [Sediminibacterium goheungense]|uniref:histidine kinase n=1 Tax=Sediminibacterium goheungense TaxID=1086393 RepID=A0A4R6IZG4_9BACT|nr:phospho-acceptor domain-containing protein [Sediminibacterium goheungense]
MRCGTRSNEKHKPLIGTLKKAAYKHGYLAITAAWLYTFSFIFINYWSYNASPQKVKSKLEQHISKLENRYAELVNDTASLHALIASTNNKVKEEATKEPFGLFVYAVTEKSTPTLLYWNANRYYLVPDDLYRQDSAWFSVKRNGEFEILKSSVPIKNGHLLVIGMIPIRWSYFIENKYLHSDFAGFEGLDDQYELTTLAGNDVLPIFNSAGKELFGIKLKPGKSFISYDSFTILLRILSIVFLLIFLNSVTTDLMLIHGFKTGFIILTGIVLLLRLTAYQFNFPFDYSKLPLYNPSIYASNIIHPSLGDLLVNAILLFWLIGVYKNHTDGKTWLPKPLPLKIRNYGNIFILSLIGFGIAGIVQSLVHDSKISTDVTNFFSLDIYSVVSFVILCFLVLSFFGLSQILLKPLIDRNFPLLEQTVTIVVSSFICLLLFFSNSEIPAGLVILLWLLLFLLIINYRKKDLDLPLLRSTFFIFWVMFFTFSIAGMVLYENRVTEFEQRKRIAEKLALQIDPSGENLLNIAATNFDDQFLLKNFDRFQNEFENKYIKDSLINQNFSGYLNKYDTRIYTFDSLYHPLYNEDSTDYAAIKTIILNQARPTIIPDLYSYDNTSEGFSYLYQKEVTQKGGTLGYLFVIIKSKRYKSEALYPELFNQVQNLSSDLNTNYAYGIYNKGKLINHFNTYHFPSRLKKEQINQFEFTYKLSGEYSELWFNGGNDKQVVVVKRNTWVVEFLTLFAYLFCSFLLIIFVFHLGSQLLKARFKWKEIKKLFRFNIRTQIQATIIFLSVFSFLVIGIATISFFIIRFNRSNEERLSKSIQVMSNEINSKLSSQFSFDDVLTFKNVGLSRELEQDIAAISDLHNVDVNFYDINGSLLTSTQPYIYNKHLLSTQMEPKAFQQLHYDNSIRYIQSERVGDFEYLSIYVPLSDEMGENYAYLNIPYLNSQNELNQEISGFLATLINLNAFIFLVAGAIAFFLTSRITASFSLIGEKMRQMNIGKSNQEIVWSRNDEIGMLVGEYNKMVRKLEQSALALARSEREGAWREMARQVAHEIKNPLTPMKLSIQYLQNAIMKGSPDVKELTSNMAQTLVEQIDQLSKIASEFSQFANIGNAKLEKIDLREVIESVIRLYATHPELEISFNNTLSTATVIADRVQMNRLLTNLLQNAVEAGMDKSQKVQVNILLEQKEGNILLVVQDDAGGIPESMQVNIFVPNFTTKSSGTGLGLAICKGIVEKANGTIWFETTEGEGTSFFIALPVQS